MRRELRFQSEIGIVRATGVRADSLSSLLRGLKKVGGSSIFFHLHSCFLRGQLDGVDPMNDFAVWTWRDLNQPGLAEKLAMVDPLGFPSIREARGRLVAHTEAYVGEAELLHRVPESRAFHFLEMQSFIVPTSMAARDLRGFLEGLRQSTPGILFYHLIDSRLRRGGGGNDFSEWLAESLGEVALADEVSRLNPYACGFVQLRDRLIRLVEERLCGTNHVATG